jgi:hypothetical protein
MRKMRFDCVDLQHQGAARTRAETAGMTIEEKLEYWKRHEAAWLKERARAQRRAVEQKPRKQGPPA